VPGSKQVPAAGDFGPYDARTALPDPFAMNVNDAVQETSPDALERLSAGECLRLLASVPVGRIVYTRRALPAVELVNFALDGGDIVIRTDPGGKLAAAMQHTVVAFEADEWDAARRSGWSVTVVGQSREVTDPADIAWLRTIGLRPWVMGEKEYFIRITPGLLNGRRLAG
jgi:uncharacterized protein